ncbi:hypothetical protein [Bacillus sp. FJAT-49736]|nr:hypothetical protein [Bacillus sp. FJAT-49736]
MSFIKSMKDKMMKRMNQNVFHQVDEGQNDEKDESKCLSSSR